MTCYRSIKSLVVLILVATSGVALAGPPPAAKRAHADRNKDGVVTPREVKAERRWEHQQRSKVDKAWEHKADKDKDGRVEPAEIRAFHLKRLDKDNDGVITVVERRTYWVGWRSVVDTELEKKYDANGDGWLDWVEARELLRDRRRVIETDGRAIVNSAIEKQFDANGDGIIDAQEAEELRAALD